uniref:Uncharacterized protein n=1 Tax=Nelumbo nucifera TaxID=4432 RepID=A0A822XSH8_NELNU|nr:TPA_asm: hypothetical protein HUJ06_023329 [Nelumbo nucifera]
MVSVLIFTKQATCSIFHHHRFPVFSLSFVAYHLPTGSSRVLKWFLLDPCYCCSLLGELVSILLYSLSLSLMGVLRFSSASPWFSVRVWILSQRWCQCSFSPSKPHALSFTIISFLFLTFICCIPSPYWKQRVC